MRHECSRQQEKNNTVCVCCDCESTHCINMCRLEHFYAGIFPKIHQISCCNMNDSPLNMISNVWPKYVRTGASESVSNQSRQRQHSPFFARMSDRVTKWWCNNEKMWKWWRRLQQGRFAIWHCHVDRYIVLLCFSFRLLRCYFPPSNFIFSSILARQMDHSIDWILFQKYQKLEQLKWTRKTQKRILFFLAFNFAVVHKIPVVYWIPVTLFYFRIALCASICISYGHWYEIVFNVQWRHTSD